MVDGGGFEGGCRTNWVSEDEMDPDDINGFETVEKKIRF